MLNQKTSEIGSLVLAVLLGVAAPALSEEVTRFVEFRDGTRLQMTFREDTLPWRETLAAGETTTTALSLVDAEELTLVYVSSSRKLEIIRQALEDLKSDDYLEREAAQHELARLGGRFLPVLEKALEDGQEVDFIWRLSTVLENITAVEPQSEAGDIYVDAAGQSHEGDVANWSPKATAYGTTLSLDRRQISRISQQSNAGSILEGPAVGLVRRIDAQESEARFAGAMHIDFETGPEGAPLQGYEDVGEMYVPWGCVLETSYPNSAVTLERGFHVHGLSQGFCAANDSPKYQGVMTIRFCQPSQIESPAGVRLVGLWVAEVKPGGTTLEAYDSTDGLLATITTTRRGSEFLALESAVPIAYLKLVPNENPEVRASYDPNYAIDDLMYESPLALSQEFDQYTLVLKSGEVLRGSQIVIAEEQLRLMDLSIGIEEVQMPMEQVWALLPICSEELSSVGFESGFVMLEDGSVLRGTPSPNGIQLARLSDAQPVDLESVVALWGGQTQFVAPPEVWDGVTPIVIERGQQLELAEMAWGEAWISAESLAEEAKPEGEDSADVRPEYTYADSPMVWINSQPEVSSGQSRVRLTSGEEFVMSDDRFRLLDWNHERIRIAAGDETIEIPISEVVLLVTDTPES